MAQFRKMVVTDKGNDLISKIMGGLGVAKFTRFALSSTVYTDAQIPALTSITGVQQTAPVSRTVKESAAKVKLEGAVTNENVATAYNLNTIAVYANDPDLGEILYAVAGADVAGYVPAYNGVTVSGVYISVTTTVSNADNVDLTIDPAAVATIGDVENLQEQISELQAFVGYTDSDIYGVEVDLENKKFTRLAAAVGLTPGANFDSVKPFGGRRRCIVTDGGVVLAYYGETGYTETGALTTAITKDGVTYSVGTAVQVMVEQPQFYYKVVPLKTEKISGGNGYHMRKGRYFVSATPKAGFKLHPLFKYNGVENDVVYLSAYEGCLYDVSASAYILNDSQVADFSNDKLSSIGNAKPISGLSQNLTRGNARKLAQKRGTGWEQQTIQAASCSELLMMIEYAGCNMQTAIGRGNVDKTDDGSSNMAEITGATSYLGNATGAVTNSNGINIVTYRGEENLWGNIWKFIDGANIEAKGIHKLYVADHGFADDTKASPYEDTGITLAKANGYVSAFGYNQDFDWLLITSEVDGNGADSALPVGDYFWQNNTYNGFTIALLGAPWDNGGPSGPFGWDVDHASSDRARGIGARAVYFPKTA